MATAYIETTIPSFYVARPSTNLIQAARQANTRMWWDSGCSELEVYTSMAVIDEISKGEELMAKARVDLLAELPLLRSTDEVVRLSEHLVLNGTVPQKAASDAVHIAVASVHRMDYLVTWNFKHIANPFLRQRLQREVFEFGFVLPIMCSPEELLQNYEDN